MDELTMKYFVLKPAGANIYAEASRAAMIVYAEVVRSQDHMLAHRLENWVELEIDEANADGNL